MAAATADAVMDDAAPSVPAASTSVVMDGQQLPDGSGSTEAAAAAGTAEGATAEVTAVDVAANGEEDAEEKPSGPPAVETLYINNLNEKVSVKIMKETLKNLFKSYGVVLDVVMHKNLRMRGQAFVAMTSRQAAARAVEEVRGFPLYGKPLNVSFARTPSDAVVKRKTPDLIEVHLEERKKRKKMARARNPLRKKAAAAKGAAKRAAAGEGPSAAPKRSNIVQMPDEYLPPNKILFIQNLPEIITKEDLENIFKAYPNLHDVRLIPGRKGIAFVEYTDEASSTVAREALHNYKVDDEHKMKVTYAKQ